MLDLLVVELARDKHQERWQQAIDDQYIAEPWHQSMSRLMPGVLQRTSTEIFRQVVDELAETNSRGRSFTGLARVAVVAELERARRISGATHKELANLALELGNYHISMRTADVFDPAHYDGELGEDYIRSYIGAMSVINDNGVSPGTWLHTEVDGHLNLVRQVTQLSE